MREINKISEALFEKIRDRFEDVTLGDEEANATQNPEDARFFNFDYVVDDVNYGNITISLIDENSLKVYFSKNISQELSDEQRKHWYKFLRELRLFAKSNLLSFEPRDITRSTLKLRDLKQVSKADSTYTKDEVISEGKLYGTSLSSYENKGPVRIIIRHKDHVNPELRGDRSRKIKAMYLETHEGERFKLPHNSLRYARAMARHVSEGGLITDEFGSHITEIANECTKLRNFKNATQKRVFEDDETKQMVEAAFEYHGLLNHTLKRIGSKKGYQHCKEQFEHVSTSYIPEEDFDKETMRERFVKRVYNDRMEDALPVVQKAYTMKKENKFAEMFEQWANNISEGTWAIPESDEDYNNLVELLSDELPLGVDAANATSALYNIIGSDSLYDQLGDLAKSDPEQDARPAITAWIQENQPMLYQRLLQDIGDDPNSEYGSADSGMDGVVNEMDDDYDEDQVESIASAIVRRILNNIGQHKELLMKAGPDGVLNAAKDVASFHAPLEELGSSDISNMVREVYREVGVEYPEMNEDYDARSPSDSASPLTHAHADYCDACDRTADQCACDDEDLEEGRVKEVSTDLDDLSDEEFKAKYGKTKEEMKQALSEAWDLSKLSRGAKGALAGAALAGATTLGYMGGQDIERDPYVAKLEQQYQQTMKAADQAYAQGDKVKAQQLHQKRLELEDKIEDAKAAAELGVGGYEGTRMNESDDEEKLERYHELIKRGMDPDDAEVEVFNDEGDEDIDEMRRLAGL